MDTPITRAEHEEFKKRLEEANKRQDSRIATLEKNIERLNTLNTSIEKLATNMATMCNELKNQGTRLEALENRDGEMWRYVVKYIIVAILGVIIGYGINLL